MRCALMSPSVATFFSCAQFPQAVPHFVQPASFTIIRASFTTLLMNNPKRQFENFWISARRRNPDERHLNVHWAGTRFLRVAHDPVCDNPQHAASNLTVSAILCELFLTMPMCRLQLKQKSNSVFVAPNRHDLRQDLPVHMEEPDQLLEHCGRTHGRTWRNVDRSAAAIPLQSSSRLTVHGFLPVMTSTKQFIVPNGLGTQWGQAPVSPHPGSQHQSPSTANLYS